MTFIKQTKKVISFFSQIKETLDQNTYSPYKSNGWLGLGVLVTVILMPIVIIIGAIFQFPYFLEIFKGLSLLGGILFILGLFAYIKN